MFINLCRHAEMARDFLEHNFLISSGDLFQAPDPSVDVEEALRGQGQYYLPSMLSFTLSKACCSAFLRKYRDQPITDRDYYLSKLYQFFVLAVLDEGSEQAYFDQAAARLITTLDSLFPDVPSPDCTNFDWPRIFADYKQKDLENILDDLRSYLPYAEKPSYIDAHISIHEAAQPGRGTDSRPGEGGQQYQYLQGFIQRRAVDQGFEVSMDRLILGGIGLADIVLHKGGLTIACQISGIISPEQEGVRIQKCLVADFAYVLCVSSEEKALEGIRSAVWGGLTAGQRKQLRFLTPQQVFSFLEGLEMKPVSLPAHGPDDLLTAKELEDLLRIDVKTIYSYAQRGLIPYVRIQSNLRFVRSEVLAWLAERQFRPLTR
ncbi:MAG: helix-turn-helix domain-containing protein [Bryobacteraceae bacterium]